jgi:hypothetical protein
MLRYERCLEICRQLHASLSYNMYLHVYAEYGLKKRSELKACRLAPYDFPAVQSENEVREECSKSCCVCCCLQH